MMRVLRLALAGLAATMLAACSGSEGFSDIDALIAEVKARPARAIEPLPEVQAYQAFAYSAANRRSPFAQPVPVEPVRTEQAPRSNITPDLDRPRELLENFDLGSMTMVGTIRRAGQDELFALVNDGEGGIHRVRTGQYLGKNFGRVTRIEPTGISLVEIVSDGDQGWFERPRTLGLNEGS